MRPVMRAVQETPGQETTVQETLVQKTGQRNVMWGLVVGGLFVLSFCLGLPQFHYATALMIGAILRHKNDAGDLFGADVGSGEGDSGANEGAAVRPPLLRLALLFVLIVLFGGVFRAFAGEPRPSRVEALGALHGEVWEAEVAGMRLQYHLVDLRGFPALGYARLEARTQTCHIYIDTWLTRHDPRVLADITLHEVGHCVDWLMLGLSHNAFADEGCAYGEYYCEPAEGYAEAWARAYSARCGADLFSVGYTPHAGYLAVDVAGEVSRSVPCALPDPPDGYSRLRGGVR